MEIACFYDKNGCFYNFVKINLNANNFVCFIIIQYLVLFKVGPKRKIITEVTENTFYTFYSCPLDTSFSGITFGFFLINEVKCNELNKNKYLRFINKGNGHVCVIQKTLILVNHILSFSIVLTTINMYHFILFFK